MSNYQRAFQRLVARARWGNRVLAEWSDEEALSEAAQRALEALASHLNVNAPALAWRALLAAFQLGRRGASSTVPAAFYNYADGDTEADPGQNDVSVVLREWDDDEGITPLLWGELRAVACRLVWERACATPDEWRAAIRQNLRYLLVAFQIGRIAAVPVMPACLFGPVDVVPTDAEFWEWLDAHMPPTD